MRLNYQMGVILEASKNCDTPIGVHEVMQYLNISKSAAYLLIQNCQTWLNENQLGEDSLQQRRELYIGKGDLKDKLKKQLSKSNYEVFDYSPRERRIYIIVLLIRKKNVSTHEIMERFRISRNTCILDLAGVNRMLEKFHLIYTAGNHGYSLSGEEYNIYQLCLWVSSKIFSELFPKNYEMAMSLFEFSQEDIESIGLMLIKASEQFSLSLNREALYIFCASCTLVSRRIHLGHLISQETIPNYLFMCAYNCRVRSILYQSGVVDAVLKQPSDATVGKPVFDAVKNGFAECLARMLICVCGETGEDITSIHIKEEKLLFYADRIMQRFEELVGMFFENKNELLKSVALSLKCISLREKHGFWVCNGLALEVKKHYIHIIGLTQKAMEEIEELKEIMSEEDCMLLSINFLGGLYKVKHAAAQTPRILVVYAGNSDSGVLLQGQIQNLLPGARVLTASLFQDLTRFLEYMDMVVSTIPIELHGIPVIVVNTFLTECDKDRIKKLTEHKFSEDEQLLRFLTDFSAISKEVVCYEDSKHLRGRIEEYIKSNRVRIKYGAQDCHMLKALLTKGRIKIKDSVEDWKEAIYLAAKPLEEDGSIEPAYTKAMILSIENMGPFIVLSPGIAIPHARPEAGVRWMSMSLLKVREKVYFTKEKYANLFFILASTDGNSHLDALRELSALFSDEAAYDKFMKADTVEKLHQLII
jgi:mannitol/fructose-specific phosphotransferase system IIA component (Ntr-type)/transcriptional antiterminator